MGRLAFLVVILLVASMPELKIGQGATPRPTYLQTAPAQPPRIDEYKMVTYEVVFVTRGPKWTSKSADVTPVLEAHRDYIAGLVKSGNLHIAGPLAGESTLQGAYVLSGSPDRAKQIAEADPGIQSGRYSFELLRWMGPEGWFGRAADPANTEKLFFGFLVTGENTSALPAADQQALMRGHLDHLGSQAKLGKLVLAGPLVNAGNRRGLIAYRVPTMADALERASADPMVKAGRMKPELYEWTVPIGALK
jgi:uncharacterized protein YciI